MMETETVAMSRGRRFRQGVGWLLLLAGVVLLVARLFGGAVGS